MSHGEFRNTNSNENSEVNDEKWNKQIAKTHRKFVMEAVSGRSCRHAVQRQGQVSLNGGEALDGKDNTKGKTNETGSPNN